MGAEFFFQRKSTSCDNGIDRSIGIRSRRYGSKDSIWAGGILETDIIKWIHERIREVKESQEEIFL